MRALGRLLARLDPFTAYTDTLGAMGTPREPEASPSLVWRLAELLVWLVCAMLLALAA